MVMEHTPGPWVIDHETRPAGVCVVYNTSHPNGFVYIRGALGYWDADRDENMANARLIAAAPELLEALELMLDAFLDTEGSHGDREQAATEAARAAIEKATRGTP